MCDAIRELFADEFAEQEKRLAEQKKQLTEQEKQLTEIKEQYQKLETEVKDNGIRVLVETCREVGVSKEDTVAKVVEKFSLNCEEAEKAVKLYW